jgi:uncharacterized membrane protein
MLTQLLDWLALALEVFNQSNHRIVWNLFLALIPLILSFWLFRPLQSPSGIWWVICLVFMAFLPNAPYILTDTIHIREIMARGYPSSIAILVLIPQYGVFVWAGFEAYAIALMRVDNYLKTIEQEKYLVAINAIAHCLCVVGIYLGRFERFNSWDLVSKPMTVISTTLKDLMEIEHILALAIAFCWLWGLSWLTKRFNSSFFRQIKLRYNLK